MVWFGTTRGAIRFDGKTWEYRQGRHWLPSDNVEADRGYSFRRSIGLPHSQGIAAIERKP